MTKTHGWTTTKGQLFLTLEECQQQELMDLIGGDGPVFADIVLNKEKVVDILTTSDSSRPKARRINGGRKSRKPKHPELIPTPEAS